MLHQTCSYDPNWIEGEVMSVDVTHSFCEVKTLNGNKLSAVRWINKTGGSSRAGEYDTPTVGDQVIVFKGLSHPTIFGYLSRLEETDVGSLDIDSGLGVGDTGNLSPSQNSSIRFGPGKPKDLVAGDKVFISEGGGMIALLRMGTVMLRSSRLAQIVLSKFDDLVRIVGRNLEVFTDTYVDVSHNLKGRIYRFVGYSENHTKVRDDNYTYQEMYGDTTLAQFAKQDSPLTGFPSAGSKIRKIRVMSGATEVYSQTLDLNGHIVDTVINGGTAYRDHDGGQIQDRVTNGAVSTVTMNGSTIVLDQAGTSIATLSGSSIVLNQGGASTATLTNSNITLVHGGASVTVNASGVFLSFGSHYINLTSTGVGTG